jgi:4-hydroxy-3-methylbut-2-enyl diphosphate reductase
MGLTVTETTCPLVHKAHASLDGLVRQGCHPVIIGQRNHVEVRGLSEDHPGCDVVLSEADIDGLEARARFGVVSQTTQPIARVRQLVEYLKVRFPASEVRFRDTVCQPTKDRQKAAEDLAAACTVVVVVGGRHSNNTRQLVATCSRFCSRVHHVESAAEVDPAWFYPEDHVGLTAGTSTPDETIDAVEARLAGIASTCSAAA